MKTKFKKFLNDKKVKVLDKKAKTKVSGGSSEGHFRVIPNDDSD